MFISVVVYIIVFVVTTFLLSKRMKKIEKIKNVSVGKNGIVFMYNYRYNIDISNSKFIIIDNQIFIKKNNKRLLIKNVDNIEQIGDKLFFNCLGRVEILFDNKDYYKFFNIIIYADKFNLKRLKYKAMQDMLNFPFEFENRYDFRLYIKIVRNILRVNFQQDKIVVKANKYFLPFKMIYKINGKIKKVGFTFK